MVALLFLVDSSCCHQCLQEIALHVSVIRANYCFFQESSLRPSADKSEISLSWSRNSVDDLPKQVLSTIASIWHVSDLWHTSILSAT